MTRIPGGSQPRRQPPGPPRRPRPVPPPANPRRRRPAGRVAALAAGALALLLGGLAAGCGITRHGKPTATVQTTPTCAVTGINGCQPQAANSGSPARHPGDPAQALPANVTQACDLNDQMRKAATSEDLRDQGATISQIQALAGASTILDSQGPGERTQELVRHRSHGNRRPRFLRSHDQPLHRKHPVGERLPQGRPEILTERRPAWRVRPVGVSWP